MKYFTDEEFIQIYNEYYAKGISSCKLVKIFGHTPNYYLKAFHRLGLAVRSNKINSRKYTADFNYFNMIDTHEKAYWLGFFYADGYVSHNEGRKLIGMSLQTKDRNQLEKLKKCLNATYNIHDYQVKTGYKPGSKYSRLVIEDTQLFDNLVSHGVVEHKTNILKPPNIKQEFISSFILGYLDGDGSIHITQAKYPSYVVSFVGTDDVLTFIHNYFKNCGFIDYDVHLEKRKKEHFVSYIRYGGNVLVTKILDELYSKVDPNLPLDRKRQLYLNCKNKIF